MDKRTEILTPIVYHSNVGFTKTALTLNAASLVLSNIANISATVHCF